MTRWLFPERGTVTESFLFVYRYDSCGTTMLGERRT